jgi:hypothetical protein
LDDLGAKLLHLSKQIAPDAIQNPDSALPHLEEVVRNGAPNSRRLPAEEYTGQVALFHQLKAQYQEMLRQLSLYRT